MENITLAPVKLKLKTEDEAEKARPWSFSSASAWRTRRTSIPNMLSGGQKQRIAIVRALCMEPGRDAL